MRRTIDSLICLLLRDAGCAAARAGACAALLLLTAACTTTPRLNANFDSDTLGARPSGAPLPTPPSDFLTWTTQRPLTQTVVADPGGGRHVRVVPLPAFLAAPDSRQLVLLASTEPFNTSQAPKIRGSMRLRLDGLGVVLVGIQPSQGAGSPDFIAGFELANFVSPTPSGGVHAVRGFSYARLDDTFGLPSAGPLAGYSAGTTIGISWSIDQDTRNFTVSVTGGASQSIIYPAVSGGVVTNPIKQLNLGIWMQRPVFNTALFIDDLFVEEYK